MAKQFKFSKSRQVRVITGQVSFYTTVGQIRDGVGSATFYNRAVQKALNELERMRSGDDITAYATGLSATFDGYAIQINV